MLAWATDEGSLFAQDEQQGGRSRIEESAEVKTGLRTASGAEYGDGKAVVALEQLNLREMNRGGTNNAADKTPPKALMREDGWVHGWKFVARSSPAWTDAP
jgi:hypothetical protein